MSDRPETVRFIGRRIKDEWFITCPERASARIGSTYMDWGKALASTIDEYAKLLRSENKTGWPPLADIKRYMHQEAKAAKAVGPDYFEVELWLTAAPDHAEQEALL